MTRNLGTDLPGLLVHTFFCAFVTALNAGVVRHERQNANNTYRTLINKCAAILCSCNIMLIHSWWPMVLARALDFGWHEFICRTMVVSMYSALTQIWLVQNELIILCYLYSCKFEIVSGLREDLAATIMSLTNFILSLLVALIVFMLAGEKINGYRICLGDDSFEGSSDDLSPMMSSSTWIIHATFSFMILHHNRKFKLTAPSKNFQKKHLNQNTLMDCTSSLIQMLVHVSIPPVLTILYHLVPMRPGLNLAGLYRMTYNLSLVIVLPLSMYMSNSNLRRSVFRYFKRLL